MPQLYVGNKNYSSWSMRPWVLLRQVGIPFDEVSVRFDSFEADSDFKRTVGSVNPTGTVPVLIDDDLAVWDTLAIAEYAAERWPDAQLWPAHRAQRARARSICAEMHAGFRSLRSHCPMNIEADLSTQGALIWRDQPGVRADVTRIVAMWSELLAAHASSHADGMLFGRFGIADAYFSPIVMRLTRYALPVPPEVAGYMARVEALPGVKAWVDGALAEQDFLDFEEPYRLGR
ncbi:glutathione S-transferase family protein [Variovorax ginsengisoli]|uniref:Glutathione S-transferase n=1 Tax=Variovorax ginsengisoli TaxID=363844 RepID=A0ABT9S218_9BURK|nr:glutathione S-transferase family protein [Variovorax ginsengisoli]MDP9898392.1 glutathione S-transferase [Variovorax ginsengisoli]